MPCNADCSRREILKWGAGMAAMGAFGLSTVVDAPAAEPTLDKRIKKAVKFGMVAVQASVLDKFKLLKELGYDGVEMDSPSSLSRDEVLRARDESGLPIHGVVDSAHWKDTLSHPDAKIRGKGLTALRTAIDDSRAMGGTTVLLVPAVVNANVTYAQAYERSQAELRKILPYAAEQGVTICLENVWNGFLLSPLETARYIDELDSPAIGAYFDVGNVVNFGWPEQWIQILGRRIVKLDIKEYSRKIRDQQGPYKGFDAEIGEGDCNWPAVMEALRQIDYRGWGTAEVPGGDRERLADIARRMDAVLAM